MGPSVLLLAAALAARPPAASPEPRVFAVLLEFDRMAALPIWPGFEPSTIPLAIFDGGRTWLVRHPHPPRAFEEVPGHASVRVFEGRHESQRANTSASLEGVPTATASFPSDGKAETSPSRLAALLLHEAFHVFQAGRHPGWGGNEAELFVYPVEDAEALALRRLESDALVRALDSRTASIRLGWAAGALALRRSRFARIPATAAAYERGTEMKEGLARYVEAVADPSLRRPFPAAEFPSGGIRERSYASGCAIALLLDVLAPEWKGGLEKKDEVLDQVLERAVGTAAKLEAPARDAAAARVRARADVAAWSASRAAMRREFLARSGWTVVVVADLGAPLFPQGFDPWNVERLSSSDVLHTRWVKLGSAAGLFEVLDRSCLTESAGAHPLFAGVRRATVTGLPEEPRVSESDGRVRVEAPGLTLDLRGARVERGPRTLTVLVAGDR